LSEFIPGHERIVLIEDTAEIQIQQDNIVRFEARREQNGLPAVTIRDLLKATLRHRPDRIILGGIPELRFKGGTSLSKGGGNLRILGRRITILARKARGLRCGTAGNRKCGG
jgi:hypothetical protein